MTPRFGNGHGVEINPSLDGRLFTLQQGHTYSEEKSKSNARKSGTKTEKVRF